MYAYFNISRNGLCPQNIKLPHNSIVINPTKLLQQLEVNRSMTVMSGIWVLICVHWPFMGFSWRRLSARFSDVDVSSRLQPSHHITQELDYISLGQVHQQPVGKHKISWVGVQLESEGIVDLIGYVVEVLVSLLVLFNERLDEVRRDHVVCPLGKSWSEAAEK